jgi:hypothetical protein
VEWTSKERPTVTLIERDTNYIYTTVMSFYYDYSKLDFKNVYTFTCAHQKKFKKN